MNSAHLAGARIGIFCVDDNPAIAESLQRRFGFEPDLKWCGSLDRADTLLAEVQRTSPTVVLLDLDMPGLPPLQALDEVIRKTRAEVIILSGCDGAKSVAAAIKAGARGFVSKIDTLEDLLPAIRCVANGGAYVSRSVAAIAGTLAASTPEHDRPVMRSDAGR